MMYNTLFVHSRKAIGKMLPEGKVKDSLRGLLHRDYNLLDIQRFLTQAKLQEDGILLVQLKDGARFYAKPEGQNQGAFSKQWTRLRRSYGNHHILTEEEGLKYFPTLWRELLEQYRDDIYQRHYKVRPGDIVVDVGAHIGIFTVRAAKAVGAGGMVIAIEPETNNLRLLERNIQLNQLRNIIVVPKGVWSKKGKVQLITNKSSGAHSIVIHQGATGSREIEVDTLDDILKELHVNRIDFIKMDIEGAELNAYDGMKETLRNNDCKLAIAAYHIVKGKETWETLAPWLDVEGFQVRVRKGIVYGMK
jgi:FkbM family methyltransferase